VGQLNAEQAAKSEHGYAVESISRRAGTSSIHQEAAVNEREAALTFRAGQGTESLYV